MNVRILDLHRYLYLVSWLLLVLLAWLLWSECLVRVRAGGGHWPQSPASLASEAGTRHRPEEILLISASGAE